MQKSLALMLLIGLLCWQSPALACVSGNSSSDLAARQREFFNGMDKNKDDQLSPDEFARGVPASTLRAVDTLLTKRPHDYRENMSPKSVFDLLDADKSGSLGMIEYAKGFPAESFMTLGCSE